MTKKYRSLFVGILLITLIVTACAQAPATAIMQQQEAPTSQPTAAKVAVSAAATATEAAQPTATQAAQPTPTQAAPALSSDEVIKTVQAAWAKQATAGSRHVSQTSYTDNTAEMNIEADSEGTNLHQVISANGAVMAEQYIYDGAIYNKLQGEWTVLQGGGNAFNSTLAGFAEGLSDSIVLADGQVLGVETLNSQSATVYSYTSTLKGLDTKPTTYTVWVDNTAGLPLKQEILDPEGQKTVQLFTYDANIKVTLPPEVAAAKPAQ